eukprot:TRINITY_DN76477_c0_g1_i1.p1 TRINITY_DN76477_c0_g1~~TRINITY_DN76477_c0_g1_i1.p1  ORF type:complete len:464 (-),score=112.69 TRINITY_DN76477_c0_g1_i1:120-1511(-)
MASHLGRQAPDLGIATADIDVNRMSVRQLKAELAARDVDISHCRDRSELLVLLRKARTAGPWDNGSFARRTTDNAYCWVELIDDQQAICHQGDGTTVIIDVGELEPISAAEFPCPRRFEGPFQAARAEAHQKGKLLIVAIVSGRGKPPRDEAMQYMGLASDEVRIMISENAIFWRGRPGDLKDTQLRQLAPVEMLPSLAVAVPLASDAMTVIIAVPGMITRDQILDCVLEGLEAMEAHRQVILARQGSEDVQIRQAQDVEYAEALAADQAADAARVARAVGPAAAADAVVADAAAMGAGPAAPAPTPADFARVVPPSGAGLGAVPAPAAPASSSAAAPPAVRPPAAVSSAAEEARRALAEEFLQEDLRSPAKTDPVRLVLKLPTGEQVKRTFAAQDALSRVYQWAISCPCLPEAEGRQLQIPESFELATAFPRRCFTASDYNSTLRELGLVPSAALLLVESDA